MVGLIREARVDSKRAEAHENEAFEESEAGGLEDRKRNESEQAAVIEFCSLSDDQATIEATTSSGSTTPASNEPASRPQVQAQRVEAAGHRQDNVLLSCDQPQSKEKPLDGQGSLLELCRKLEASAGSDGSEPQWDEFEISWHELSYVVESKWFELTSQKKPILDKLSGAFKSGELSAVLGPSGAGKSTLIDCLLGKRGRRGLCGRTQVRFTSGARRQSGAKKAKAAGKAGRKWLRIATIPQADHLLDNLTVFETLMFASRIKNAHLAAERNFSHLANVQRVLQQLTLASCAQVRCSKLSGGQYKRVSIGQELLSRPDLLVLDEPTSGLDSVTCHQTVAALRDLIKSSVYPMAIVATIHQPDLETVSLFDRAYVLALGGRAIYEGPVHRIFAQVRSALELVESRALPAGPKQAPGGSLVGAARRPLAELRHQLAEQLEGGALAARNPARLIVEIASHEYGLELSNTLASLQADRCLRAASGRPLAAAPTGSGGDGDDESSSQQQQPQPPSFSYEANEPRARRAHLDPLLDLRRARAGQARGWLAWWRHLLLHCRRSWLTIVRDPMLFSVQLLLHVLVPLLISYAFSGEARTDACPRVGPLDVVQEAYRSGGDQLAELNGELRSSMENLGYVFFQLYVIIFAAVCVTSLTYPLVMHVLLKEYRNGWYSLSAYFLGRTLADLPVPSFNVALAMAISYHLTGQPVDAYNWRFWSIAGLTVLATLVAQTMGLMFGALLMNAPQSAVFVAPASTAPLVVVCGFLLRIKSLPVALQYLSQLSYFTHLINGVVISRYGFNRCPCTADDFLADERHLVPAQARATIDLWVETFAGDYNYTGAGAAADKLPAFGGQASSNSAPLALGQQIDLVGKLTGALAKAKTFNHAIEDCAQMRPFVMLDYGLEDGQLILCFAALFLMLLAFRWLTYTVLHWKINTSI